MNVHMGHGLGYDYYIHIHITRTPNGLCGMGTYPVCWPPGHSHARVLAEFVLVLLVRKPVCAE